MNLKGKRVAATGAFQSAKAIRTSGLIILIFGLVALLILLPILAEMHDDSEVFRGEVFFSMGSGEFLMMIAAIVVVLLTVIVLGANQLYCSFRAKNIGEDAILKEVAISPNNNPSVCYMAILEDAGSESNCQKAASPQPSADAEAAPAGTSFCTGCGSQLASDELFCSKCGIAKKQ